MIEKTKRRLLKLLMVVTLAVIAGIYWREAGNEIYYLCQNFDPGVTEADVMRQLETGQFLKTTTNITEGGKQLLVTSKMPLVFDRCELKINREGIVTYRISR
jgi:hypothetical protein